MGKQILTVLGGGRPKGNTAQLADAFTQGAEAAGHAVETPTAHPGLVRRTI